MGDNAGGGWGRSHLGKDTEGIKTRKTNEKQNLLMAEELAGGREGLEERTRARKKGTRTTAQGKAICTEGTRRPDRMEGVSSLREVSTNQQKADERPNVKETELGKFGTGTGWIQGKANGRKAWPHPSGPARWMAVTSVRT